ncbi:hypothetical protein STEG23_008459, partial [Scotinomys teguina]
HLKVFSARASSEKFSVGLETWLSGPCYLDRVCQMLTVTQVLKVWWKETSLAPASGRRAVTCQRSCFQTNNYKRRGYCK